MGILGFLWSAIFARMPFPIRLVMNLLALPFIIPIFLFQIIRNTLSTPPTDMIDFKDLKELLILDEADSDAELATLETILKTAKAQIADDRWADLGQALIDYDQANTMTTGNTPITSAIFESIWRDVLKGIKIEEDDCGPFAVGKIPFENVAPYIDAAEDHPDNYALNALAGWLCLNLGWMARGGDYAQMTPDQAFADMRKMFDIADVYLDSFDARESNSALMARVAYDRLTGIECELRDLHAAFNLRMDLNPHDYEAMAAYAFHLLPRWYGDYALLDEKAREAFAATHHQIGASAYAAFYLGVIMRDDVTLATMDMDLFERGIMDMIDTSADKTAAVNTLLGQLFDASVSEYGLRRQPAVIGKARKRIGDMAISIVRGHLATVVGKRWSMNRQDRFYFIARAFEEPLMDGQPVHVGSYSPEPAIEDALPT